MHREKLNYTTRFLVLILINVYNLINILQRPVTVSFNSYNEGPLDIYLIWTTEKNTFGPRHFAVLNSYFYHHPNAKITVFAKYLDDQMFSSFTNNGYSIAVESISQKKLLGLKCPGQEWLKRINEYEKGKYFYSHLTDYIRFCVLYSRGGVYSDFDAILLKQLPYSGDFIAKDHALGECSWCLFDDVYLAPGLMGTQKKSVFVYNALMFGFDDHLKYEMNVFNSVGPKAVTKAYKSNPVGVQILDSKEFYPFNYLNATDIFTITDSQNRQKVVSKLLASSISLHLYGHMARNLPILPGSIAYDVMDRYDLHLTEKCFLKLPRFVSTAAELGKDIRVIGRRNDSFDPLTVLVSSVKGSLQIGNVTSHSLRLTAQSVSEMNHHLSLLVYMHQNYQPDRITFEFNGKKSSIRVISQLEVSIMIKTVGRMDKVFNLVDSIRDIYSQVPILVSDDGEYTQSEGYKHQKEKKGFHYYPLPFDVGLSAGRNYMLSKIETPFFFVTDDDFEFDQNSDLYSLVHALEIFDIAGGKNPIDEEKYGIDFSGIIEIEGKTLILKGSQGEYDETTNCFNVDFVPNLFAGRTDVFKYIEWDPNLKVGEHEDFFLRAKQQGLKVATCPHVSFIHKQTEHWLLRNSYDRMRSRVWNYLRQSLEKHELNKLVSFNRVMVDIRPPTRLDLAKLLYSFPTALILTWKSKENPVRVLVKSGNREYETDYKHRSFILYRLTPCMNYSITIYSGNSFEFEEIGYALQARTSCSMTKISKFEAGIETRIEYNSDESLVLTNSEISNQSSAFYMFQTLKVDSFVTTIKFSGDLKIERIFGHKVKVFIRVIVYQPDSQYSEIEYADYDSTKLQTIVSGIQVNGYVSSIRIDAGFHASSGSVEFSPIYIDF